MKLYFTGHDERYAVEQTLLTLFPQERPLYPGGAPEGGEGELVLQFDESNGGLSATATLRYHGHCETARDEAPRPNDPAPVAQTRARRRCCITSGCEGRGACWPGLRWIICI